MDQTLHSRFWGKVARGSDDECWLWTAGVSPRGYGKFWAHGKSLRAHRVSYEITNGNIVGNFLVLHRCDNPRCVNPAHLFLGTTQDNSDDKVNKLRHARGIALSAAQADKKPKGESHGMAKLSDEIVRDIRQSYTPGRKAGNGTPQFLARKYGVDRTLIHMVVTQKIWKHVGPGVDNPKVGGGSALPT